MKRDDQPFVIGHRNGKGTTVLLLRGTDRPVFPGPWTLRAVVAPGDSP